ncbi:MAG TPA: hypothetical protein VMX58_00190 [Patescibacteria group bacterium]|nr:hypothetical protein [Patescibacteria group bacterium]
MPVEFIVYPNTGHHISDMRYQLAKMQAELAWFERWIRGAGGWIDWKGLIGTVKRE